MSRKSFAYFSSWNRSSSVRIYHGSLQKTGRKVVVNNATCAPRGPARRRRSVRRKQMVVFYGKATRASRLCTPRGGARAARRHETYRHMRVCRVFPKFQQLHNLADVFGKEEFGVQTRHVKRDERAPFTVGGATCLRLRSECVRSSQQVL